MRETIAVADSGPLIGLARITKLELLPGLFSEIIVPPEVWNEVTIKGRGLPGAYEISRIKWITIQPQIRLKHNLRLLKWPKLKPSQLLQRLVMDIGFPIVYHGPDSSDRQKVF